MSYVQHLFSPFQIVQVPLLHKLDDFALLVDFRDGLFHYTHFIAKLITFSMYGESWKKKDIFFAICSSSKKDCNWQKSLKINWCISCSNSVFIIETNCIKNWYKMSTWEEKKQRKHTNDVKTNLKRKVFKCFPSFSVVYVLW